MPKESLVARLYLDGHDVGQVKVRRWEGAWGFGEFQAGPGFEPFEACYTRWSRLMHQDDARSRLSREASKELRQLEGQLAGIDARLFFLENEQWRAVATVNIDGPLIEWKERWSGGGSSADAVPAKSRRSPCSPLIVAVSPTAQQQERSKT